MCQGASEAKDCNLENRNYSTPDLTTKSPTQEH